MVSWARQHHQWSGVIQLPFTKAVRFPSDVCLIVQRRANMLVAVCPEAPAMNMTASSLMRALSSVDFLLAGLPLAGSCGSFCIWGESGSDTSRIAVAVVSHSHLRLQQPHLKLVCMHVQEEGVLCAVLTQGEQELYRAAHCLNAHGRSLHDWLGALPPATSSSLPNDQCRSSANVQETSHASHASQVHVVQVPAVRPGLGPAVAPTLCSPGVF
jgi:hypothetical protein